jgi:hypothetical protein
MYSYPNLIPLGPDAIRGIVAALEPYEFERIVGTWWGRIVPGDGKAIVRRSAERYLRAISSRSPTPAAYSGARSSTTSPTRSKPEPGRNQHPRSCRHDHDHSAWAEPSRRRCVPSIGAP